MKTRFLYTLEKTTENMSQTRVSAVGKETNKQKSEA